jgi:hypothetical protein
MHLMPARDKFSHNGGADQTRPTKHKDAQLVGSMRKRVQALGIPRAFAAYNQ